MKIELDWLKRWAMYSPEVVAVRCADSARAFTYREMHERSGSLAARLAASYGLSRGDRVAVLALNEPETVFLFFALQRLGAILVPVNHRLASREVAYVCQDSSPKVVFFQESFREAVAGVAGARPFAELAEFLFADPLLAPPAMAGEFEDPVMILYTSGTTGFPKGALITNQMLFWNSVNTGLRLSITPADSTLIFHPFFHTSGWNVLTTPFLHHGASVCLLKKFDAERVLALCESEKVTVLFGVPTMMDRMSKERLFASVRLESVRYAVVGGEPMPIELIEVWARKGVPVRQGFGLTEFGPNVFSLNEEDAVRKIGSIGFPNFYVDVKVVGEGGVGVSQGEIGELCLRGPVCSPGYWKNETATAEAIRDGWFHTGDLVRQDEEGYYYVVGRKKEMFISGAENVYPAEIERYLRSHPEIWEVAVVGVKDPQWGEVGKCFYSTRSKVALPSGALRAFCEKGLARYKIPKAFEHLSELPKGDSGKILRRMLVSPHA